MSDRPTYRYPADLRRLTPEQIDRMRVAELRVCLLEAVEEIDALDAQVADARGGRRDAEHRATELSRARATAEARVEALEECNHHERTRLDNIAGLTGPRDELDGWELDEALGAIRKLLRSGRG